MTEEKPIVHSITVTVLDEHFDRDAFDMVFVAMKNISRNLLPESAIEVRNGGMVSESIRGNGAVGDSVGGDDWWSLPVFHIDYDGSSGEGETVVRDPVRSHHRLHHPGRQGLASRIGGHSLGWAGALGYPESGSDRLTEALRGTPVSITAREDQIVKVGSHRGRRRRLLDLLKKAGAGRRFRR